jgi:glycosyltransferase involved in cell wall biosynthesis
MSASPTRLPRPSVSVVLPTHNRPEWLEQAITSVLDGEYEDFEIIVSNNGRPEHTRRLAQRIDDPRVRWIERAPCGTLENFLGASSLARGEYIAPLHDDDWWHPQMLARLVAPLRAYREVVVAFADQWQVTTTDGEVDRKISDQDSMGHGRARLAEGLYKPFTDIAARESIPQIGCVFRRDAVSISVPPEVGPALDIWRGYRLAVTGGAAYFCRDRLVYCRLHANNDFVVDGTNFLISAVYIGRRMLADPRMAADRHEVTRRLAGRHQSLGGKLLRQDSRKSARTHLGEALRLRPTAKGAGAWVASWVTPTSLLPFLSTSRENVSKALAESCERG